MIFHITTSETWQEAQINQEYRVNSLEQEGFIHCSTQEQVLTVANTFYTDYEQLIVLAINPNKLLAEVKWESPVHPNTKIDHNIDDSQKFPHIYGAIDLDAVEKVIHLCKSSQGLFDNF